MGLAYLYKTFGNSVGDYLELDFLQSIPSLEVAFILKMLEKNINTPLTSSTGRLFDAVSALLNICTHSSFHAEAPMRLEAAVNKTCKDFYSYNISKSISLDAMFKEMLYDLNKGEKREIMAAKFHNTIINIILAIAKKTRDEKAVNKVVLSGGSFQNRYLLEQVENLLSQNGFEVYSHLETSASDGSLALGQMVIAAKHRELGFINIKK